MRYIIIFTIFFSANMHGQKSDWIIQFERGSKVEILDTYNKNKGDSLELLSAKLNIWRFMLNTEPVDPRSYFKTPDRIISVFENLELENRNTSPNDFFYSEQWNLNAINIEKAWDQSTGGKDNDGNDIVIAVLDDGFDVFHEDLIDNFWFNQSEIPNDQFDNDGNGYIDDHMGVNIQTGSGIHAGVKHGTQVTGILGASSNNGLGISGINWNSKLLLVSGVSNIGEVIKAMEYIYQLKKRYLDSNGNSGANIIVNNFSGGLRRIFPEDFPSWCEMYELLGEVGILSVGAVANENFDVEAEGDMPTLCPSEYLITATNTNSSNEKVLDAAYGSTSVDLGAPGENIISTSIGNDYENISGTSASAPHVTGVIGLLHSLPCSTLSNLSMSSPSEASKLVKNAVLNGTDIVQSLSSTVTGGKLNAFKSMVQLQELCGTQSADKLSMNLYPSLLTPMDTELIIEYQTTNTDPHQIRIYDSQGRLIYKDEYIPPLFENEAIRLDLTSFERPKGMLFLQFSNSDEQISQKLVCH